MAFKKTVFNFSKEEMLKIDNLLQNYSIKKVAKLMGMSYMQFAYRCELSPVLDKVVKDAVKFRKTGIRPNGYLNFSDKRVKEVEKIKANTENSKFNDNEISPSKALENFQKKFEEDRRRRSLQELKDMEWI